MMIFGRGLEKETVRTRETATVASAMMEVRVQVGLLRAKAESLSHSCASSLIRQESPNVTGASQARQPAPLSGTSEYGDWPS